ncbi:hypothetical protein NUW58_g9841 [Xylaria curta]|uniref:Uncharacterized protein n=1 Tax=Xylaria curta TaxID=42375 RepID=A0ACC1MT03_9PEZI|nr:hypothetical protein NUW58_g9841 [Xylaria curta]
MVGVPKSKRCTFCKARKTKCDENWPTCGTCARAGKICSGARNTFKFVVNGSHNELAHGANRTENVLRTERLPLASSGASSTARQRHVFMLDPKHMPPLEPATTCAYWEPFFPLIPQHLSSGNTALGHAVELLLGAWTNSRRGLPSGTWLDLNTYNRAIGSLKTALDDANLEQLNNTLTALCVLQKTEVLYDFNRGSNQENHAAGLIAVINRRGPRQPMTKMALHVTFESIFHMLQEDIRQERESDFHTLEWMTSLKEAIDDSDIPTVLKHLYCLWVDMTAWPGLARLVRLLRLNPSDTRTARELHLRATSLAERLRHEDETTLASLAEKGDITKVENTTRPDLFPKCYKFADFPTAKLFSSHALFSIITYRCLQEADSVLARTDPSIDRQARRFSVRTWMAYPWLRSQTPLAVDFTGSLVFSYEAGNKEEREFCIKSLREMDSSRHPPPIGRWDEATIMANAKAYSGRLPFIKTQDPNVEYEGIGCRS